MNLIHELKRRNVFKVAAAYLALGWVITQVTATVAPFLRLPEWTVPMVVWIGVIGFPCVLLFSWIYELTPEGLKREAEIDRSASITHLTSRRLDAIIIGLLVLAIGLFAYGQLHTNRTESPSAPAQNLTNATAPDSAAKPAAATAATSVATPPAATPAPDARSIAVLPFINMSSDTEQEYFSDGLSEELLNQLAKIQELRVTSRSSAFAFKGKNLEMHDIAARLGVAHILEGSVRKSGERVRITAQLIDTRSDTHLWSETFDRTLADVFAVQDEIAGAVVGKLKISLLGAVPTATKTDPKAYALFLQARQLSRQNTAAGLEQSIALYQQALAIDPGYAAAWTGLGRNYSNQAINGLRPADEAAHLAHEALDKALAIDPKQALAYALLARNTMASGGDLATAARLFEQALALEPTNPDIIGNAAVLAELLNHRDQAIALNQYAVERDPLSPTRHNNLAFTYLGAGRADEAATSFRATLALSPDFLGAKSGLGFALQRKGDAQAALAMMEQEQTEVGRLMGLAIVQYTLGHKGESDAALAALVDKHARGSAAQIAAAHAWRGENDLAFEWLEKAEKQGEKGLHEFVIARPFEKIHEDPRWLPYLRRLGMAPEQLAQIKFDVNLPQ